MGTIHFKCWLVLFITGKDKNIKISLKIAFKIGESIMSDETITTAEDKDKVAEAEGVPPLNLEDDEARPDSTARNTARSTLER